MFATCLEAEELGHKSEQIHMRDYEVDKGPEQEDILPDETSSEVQAKMWIYFSR